MKDIYRKVVARIAKGKRSVTRFFSVMTKREKKVWSVCAGIFLLGIVWVYSIAPVLPIRDPYQHTAKICRIDRYGADKEDASKTRGAFKKAFAECAPGGTVVVPWGTWKTGGIKIPSDVTLRFDFGSTLSFSDDPAQYLPVVATRWEGMDVMNYQPLLYVPNAKNVAIIGHGTLIGNGGKWWRKKDDKKGGIGEEASAKKLYGMAKEGVPIEDRIFGSTGTMLRPSFLQFYESDEVVVDGPIFSDGPMWTIHPVYSKNVTIRNTTVKSTGPNTDGIAIDSSENVLVSDCEVGSGDDAIVVKSGLDYDGWKRDIPAKHIVIQNSRVIRGNAGVTIGSEMSGGVEDVLVKNVAFNYVDTGIRLKTLKGRGGYIRDIRYENITMRNIADDAVQLDLKYKFATLKSESDEKPKVEDISFDHIFVRKASNAFRIGGVESAPIENIAITNSSFSVDTAGKINDIINAVFQNVSLLPYDGNPIVMENMRNASFSGYFPRGGRGDVFANLKGSHIENIVTRLFPCPKNGCMRQDAKVPAGALLFEP